MMSFDMFAPNTHCENMRNYANEGSHVTYDLDNETTTSRLIAASLSNFPLTRTMFTPHVNIIYMRLHDVALS